MQKLGFIVITNAIRPYHRHNISILSFPPGAKYHFRYRRPFVSDVLPEDIEGCPGLLILRNWKSGEMLPLRWCTGVRKENYGEYIFFDFQFDSIFDVRSLAEAEAWRTYQAAIEATLPKGVKNVPETDLAPLVFPVPSEALKQFQEPAHDLPVQTASTDHVRRWLAIVSLVGMLEAYRDEHFYTVSRVYEDRASSVAVCDYRKLSAKRNGYRLVGNRVYFVEVIQVTVPFKGGKGPVEELRLTSPAGHIQELRTSWVIDGPYDRARFLLYVVPQETRRTPSLLILSKQPSPPKERTSSEKSERELAAEGPADTPAATTGGPPVPPTLLDLDIVWGAKRYFGKRVLPGITFVIGVFLFFGADWAAKCWPLNGIPKAADYLRYAAVFALAWAFNSFSSFVSSLKVTTKGQN